jgi:hypothetical protein
MKCVRLGSDITHAKILRIADVEAQKLVASGKGVYVSKEVWKKSRGKIHAPVEAEDGGLNV